MEFKYLALPPSDPALGLDGHVVLSKFTLHPDYVRRIDAAGEKFEQFYREKILRKEEIKVEEEEVKEEFTQENINDWEKKRKKKKTEAELLQDSLAEDDLYGALGLGDLGMGSTTGDIKSAYRKMALLHHPDKNNTTVTDPMWLKIQKAYETLTDPDKKKKYDSTLKFDETIPDEPCDPEKYFEVFGPAFQRNSVWSVKKNIPNVGNMDTPIKEVNRFYDWWDAFESWRDFTVFDEYNLEDAESRYERRYMERENKKIKGEHLKKERQRIKKLVEMGRQSDPRIMKFRKEEEEARLRKKLEQQQKKEKYKQDLMDKEKKEEDEKRAKEKLKEDEEKEKADKIKRQQDDMKNALKNAKLLVKDKVNKPKYDKFFMETFLEGMNIDDVSGLVSLLEAASKDKAFETFEKFIEDHNNVKVQRKKQLNATTEKNKVIQQQEKKGKEVPWAVEEISMLAKALVKYPVGSKARWECIATFLGGVRTQEEVIQKAKELAQGQSLKSQGAQVSSVAFATMKNVPNTMKQVDAEPDKRLGFDQTNVPTATVAEEELWTQAQQQQLEKALREFPASLDPQERWAKISGAVEGKSKKQCVDRFKELRSAVMQNKPKA
jgi:DnaJ family protein C protein 2